MKLIGGDPVVYTGRVRIWLRSNGFDRTYEVEGSFTEDKRDAIHDWFFSDLPIGGGGLCPTGWRWHLRQATSDLGWWVHLLFGERALDRFRGWEERNEE